MSNTDSHSTPLLSRWDRILRMAGIEREQPPHPLRRSTDTLPPRHAPAPARVRLRLEDEVVPAAPAPARATDAVRPARSTHYHIASWTKLIGMSTAFLAAVSSLIMAFSGILTQLAQTNLVPSRGCTAPAQVLVFDVRPQDIALGATAEVALRFTRAKAWHISSRLGNTLSRVQGSVPGSGDAVTTYRADSVGRDTLTLTVTPQDPACEVDVRTGTVVVSGGE